MNIFKLDMTGRFVSESTHNVFLPPSFHGLWFQDVTFTIPFINLALIPSCKHTIQWNYF
jgi:hypothetical protein